MEGWRAVPAGQTWDLTHSGEAEVGKNSVTLVQMHFCSPCSSPAWVSKQAKQALLIALYREQELFLLCCLLNILHVGDTLGMPCCLPLPFFKLWCGEMGKFKTANTLGLSNGSGITLETAVPLKSCLHAVSGETTHQTAHIRVCLSDLSVCTVHCKTFGGQLWVCEVASWYVLGKSEVVLLYMLWYQTSFQDFMKIF